MHRDLRPLLGKLHGFTVLLALMAGLLAAPPVLGADAHASFVSRPSEAGPERLPLLPGGSAVEAAPAVRVLARDGDGLVIEFELPALDRERVAVGEQTFDVLAIPGGGFVGEVGAPMLPAFSRFVQVPDRAGVRIEVLAAETTELPDLRPMPMQGADGSAFVWDPAAYARAGFGSSERLVAGEPALARGVRLVPLSFQPVRYDAARRVTEVATRIRARISFAGEDPRNARTRPARPLPPSFDRLFRALVLDYEPPRVAASNSLGVDVIICPDNAALLTILDPLVAWRTRKGFDVHLVTTAQTGTSRESIKAWIQSAYDTWSSPPEYITLIGDATGGISLPCWYETYSGYNGETDHPYVQLEGADILADAHIGRISVDSTDRLRLYVEKIVSYESTPYMAETDWYDRACIVGDASTSGYTCIQIGQWLKSRLREWGYAEVDTVFSGAFVTQMTAKLNRGDTVFSYRGYYGMSGFGTGNIQNLQNGRKMPFAVNLTCDTGSFAAGTARSEAWIRAGSTGTPLMPTGGIAAIGTATTGTHTRFNNCVTYGIWHGVFWDNSFHFGEALTRGKYELYVNYGISSSYTGMFTCWNNLMGDPAGEIWTGLPRDVSVAHPATLTVGATSLAVTVMSGGAPCEGAFVCAHRPGEVRAAGYTDAAGVVELPLAPLAAGTLQLTVSGHDRHPYLADVVVAESEPFVGCSGHVIDDDRDGTSNGNGDGLANPTELIELPVQVRNYGSLPVTGITASLSSSDPYVTILDGEESFGDIPAGGEAWCADDFDIRIDPGAPDGHAAVLAVDLTDGVEVWHALIELPVVSAAFTCAGQHFYGFGGDRIDPGEAGEISVSLENLGTAAGSGVAGTLVSRVSTVTVTDAQGSYGLIGAGGAAENTFDRFGISVMNTCFPGSLVPMRILLGFSGGARDTVDFVLSVGQAATTDPTGPDGHGYYAFDNTDLGYPQAPIYGWIDLDPAHGGPGTSLGFSDHGDGQDESRTVDLPFPFTYYGETFTRATICTNGWLAMGQTYLTNYRNWNIPGAGAPPNMIAVMWDDLYQDVGSQVYTWHDEARHRFVIHWNRMYNAAGASLQNFEAILYDPTHYGTETGDGMIVFQYETFNNTDPLQQYSTTGIQNRMCSDGVLYGYSNAYNRGATPIISGRAILFTALSDLPRGTLTGAVTNATNGGSPVAGATITLLETGVSLLTGPTGRYLGALPVGTYTLVASHPSFAPQTVGAVTIAEGQTTVADFALRDVVPPLFSGTTDYGATTSTAGPYYVYTTVIEESNFTELELRYNIQGTGWRDAALVPQGNYVYRAAIPGQPYTTLVHYYMYGSDVGGNAGTDPANPPGEVYSFWVMPPTFEDPMEYGPGTWTHEAVTGGYTDQWHLSSQDNHSPEGSWCWKFGSTGTSDYANYSDGALVTEPMFLAGEVTMTFWHRIEAEASTMYPEYAYDGGLIEMSVDGGDWMPVTPAGGYTHRVRIRPAGPGPFAAETPVFSGTFGWREEVVDLTGIMGETRFRFRFGSDYASGGVGWFIDDVLVMGDHPGYADAGDDGVPGPLMRPTRVALLANAPNPFSPQAGGTRIAFDLPQASTVALRVVDPSGRLVRSLADGARPAGRHVSLWDGRDADGRTAPSGVYFYVLDVEGRTLARRLMVLQ